MMNNIRLYKLLTGLFLLILTACSAGVSANGLPTPAPLATPGATQALNAPREAQVQSVEIQVETADPAHINVIARGQLTEACATFADPHLTYAANTFLIKLLTTSHSDQNCAQITTAFEKSIPLDTSNLPGGDYTVKVNGVSAVFSLPVGKAQTAVPTASSEAGQKKTFRSDLYDYEMSYPADWTIRVNASEPGDGQHPEYVTLSTGGPGHLPEVDVWARTGAAPMSGYENCDRNFTFRGFPACHLSVPAGQNPAGELWIFQKGNANFYIRMMYDDPSALPIFDEFLSSFEFVQ